MSNTRVLSRRAFLVGASAAAAVTRIPEATGGPATEGHSTALIDLGAAEAVGAMSRGEVSAERYAGALLGRCAAGKALNAFITLEPERVLEAARACDKARLAGRKPGPLFGLPIPVKDSVNTAEYRTTAGTPALRNFRPAEDAPVVKSLRGSGAIVLGKTNLHELSYGWTSNNQAFGAVHNPYDPARIPGGSSGGTAAAVAARMAPLGVAEDTEGSIRVPAAFCGLAGFRPTTGRYPTHGCVPISPLFDQVGPHARSVADIVLFDSVVAADFSPLPSVSLRGIRLGVVRDYWFTDLDPEVERLTHAALRVLADAGAELVESKLPDLARLIDLTTNQVQNHDVRIWLPRFLAEFHTNVGFDELVAKASADIREIFRSDVLPGGAGFVAEADYVVARDTELPALRRLYADYFARDRVDAIVFPTTLVPPPRIGDDGPQQVGGTRVSFETAVARNIAPGSTAGLPGLVLPVGLTKGGLPVSIEFDGPAGSDRRLLAIAQSAEHAIGRLPAAEL